MTYNNYELNYTIEQLENMIQNETTDVVLISNQQEEYTSLSDNNKKILNHLVNAAKVINNVSLIQDNAHNLPLKKALEEKAKTDKQAELSLKLFNFINGVSGLNGIDETPITIFKNLTTPCGKNFYPEDLTKEEFHQILITMFQNNKIDEIKKILSSRTMVIRENNELKAIDYTSYFKDEFSLIAEELEQASTYATNQNLKNFLIYQAKALRENNEEFDALADKHWAMLQDEPIEFTISRENYDDELTPTVLENKDLKSLLEKHNIEPIAKDKLGARVGITNKTGTALLLKFKDTMKELASLMPYSDTYTQNISENNQIKQTMVDVDLISLTGDYAEARGGITIAQNLPNNDKLSIKQGNGRRNVYHRQVRQSHDAKRTQKMLDTFLHKDFHQYYNVEADHIFVIGHENGHSLGPSSEYQNSPGICKSIIEENKADTISISFMPEYVKKNIITDRQLKEIYTTWITRRLLLSSKPIFPTETYKIVDLIEFNTLLEYGAIYFDEDKLLHIDFEKVSPAIYELLKKVIDIQLSKSPTKAKAHIDRYTTWTDLHDYIATTQKKLGVKKYKNIVSYF